MSFGFSIIDFITAIELVNKIRKEIRGCPAVRSLSIVLQDIDNDLSESQLTSQEKTKLESIGCSCTNLLHRLQKIIGRYGELDSNHKAADKKLKRAWKRLAWEPDEVRELRNRISSNVGLLNAFNVRAARHNTAKLARHYDNEESARVLEWLSSVDYSTQQSKFINRRQSGTGRWLLDSGEYQTWLKKSTQTLFCPGIPGAGKTVLTSVVIDDLTTRLQSGSDFGIAYLYFDFRQSSVRQGRNPFGLPEGTPVGRDRGGLTELQPWRTLRQSDKQKAEDLLANLHKQLSQTRSSVPESVKEFYDHHKGKQTRPSLNEVSKVLSSVASLHSRIFIVLDALNEFQASNGDPAKFLTELFDFQTKCRANVFATSRFITEIFNHFKGSQVLEIRASDDDVKRYLEGHVWKLPSFVQRNRQLQDDIVSGISDVVDGMFLLAQIYLGSLDDKLTPKAIRAAIKDFRKQDQALDQGEKLEILGHAYDQSMERINGQKQGFRELAKKVLSWMTHAKRLMGTLELQHALAVEIGEAELDPDNIPDIEDVVSVCAGLVTVDEESATIRLVHYTTQEYFNRTGSRWFPSAEDDIAATCSTYLSYHVFETDMCERYGEFEERRRFYYLYCYAANNWGHHAREALSCCDEVLRFLKCEPNVESSFQELMCSASSDPHFRWEDRGHITGLHLVVYFNIQKAVEVPLMEHCANLTDAYGRTPLVWAAENGHDKVVKLLMDNGADIDLEDHDGYVPLSQAAANGHVATVKLLLATQNVDVNSRRRTQNSTPLLLAAANGHRDVVELLLENGAELECTDAEFDSTPVLWASWRGHEAVVKLLLDKGANPEPRNFYRSTPLLLAVDGASNVAVVNLLLLGRYGIDADARDDDERTALSYAAEAGHEEIVQLLLSYENVDVDSNDVYGCTPLSYAASLGNEGVVKLLLATGRVEAGSTNKGGRTPLSYAAELGNEAIVELLWGSLIGDESMDAYSRTRLSYATIPASA